MNFFNISSDRDLRFFYFTVERKFCFKMKEIFKIKSNNSSQN